MLIQNFRKLGENNKFTDAKMYSEENTIYSDIIEGLEINLKDVFDL